MENLYEYEFDKLTTDEDSSSLSLAADLFSCLSTDAQDKIIDLIKSLLSAK